VGNRQGDIELHETARVHPSAVLEGRVRVGPYTFVGAGTVITGDVEMGHHSLVQCNVVIRGTNRIGNYVHIYDLVCIEGGRPAQVGGSAAEEPDRSVIEDEAWINHGATMHGSRVGRGAVLGLNAALDYDCRIGAGAIVTDGSACPIGTVVPPRCVADGVPARIVQREITDEDLVRIMGVHTGQWVRYAGEQQEWAVREGPG
jgi:carbonic anhydrase/acetyltransferase-like protein (isoleucine patch superfamily)